MRTTITAMLYSHAVVQMAMLYSDAVVQTAILYSDAVVQMAILYIQSHHYTNNNVVETDTLLHK